MDDFKSQDATLLSQDLSYIEGGGGSGSSGSSTGGNNRPLLDYDHPLNYY